MEKISELFRNNAAENDTKRDAGLTTPEDVRRFDDIRYGADEKWNLLDVYRPKEAEGRLPVIVSVHGGGWVYGDKEVYQYYCMSLARRGFAVVNYTYRLAPEYKYPAPLEDANSVFGWILDNADEYGFDTENIFALGDSAGAHLLGLYCCLCTDPQFAKSLSIAVPAGFVPKAVALNCGAYTIGNAGESEMTLELMKEFLPWEVTEERLREVSVTEHLNAAFPPSFVMTAEGDFLADQAEPFYNRLRELGVPAEYHYYGDTAHVLGHVFHCNIRLPEAEKCNTDECDFFRGYCK